MTWRDWFTRPLLRLTASSGFPWPAGRDAAIERELIVSNAVRLAMVLDCGIAADAVRPSYDLLRTGKLHEVIYHAARRLDVDPGLTTVADVVALLVHAKEQST